jgi:hypothetical protein
MNTSPEKKCKDWKELDFKSESDCLDAEHSHLVGGKKRRRSTRRKSHKHRSHKRRAHRKSTHKRRAHKKRQTRRRK